MANPPCMSNDGRPAVFLGTFLEGGETVALCDECLVAWSAALLQSMTGVDPTPFLQAISEGAVETPEGSDTPRPADVSAAPAASDPPPSNAKPGRGRSGSPAAGTDADPDAPPEPAASTADTPAA